MNLLSWLPLVGTLVSTTPTALVRSNTFAKIEIYYKADEYQRHMVFQLEAHIGNKWVLIDDDVNCPELRFKNIMSCIPIAVKREKVLTLSLKDCEFIYAYPFTDYKNLLIRLKTLTYHDTKTGYYIDKPRYFEPFWITN